MKRLVLIFVFFISFVSFSQTNDIKVFTPDFLVPDGNGYLDVWKPEFSEQPKDYKLYIYCPYTNEVLFQTDKLESSLEDSPFFLIYKFNSEEELQQIVKNLYGNGCFIEKYEFSENGSYKKLVINWNDELPVELRNCNWGARGVLTNINLAENKIAIIDLGQSANLINSEILVNSDPKQFQYKVYDFEIVDSIVFY
jgi:hypothetical protein